MSGLEKIEVNKAQQKLEETFLKDLKIPNDPKKVQLFIDNELETKYGPDAFGAALRGVLSPYINNPDALTRAVKEAVSRYKEAHRKLKNEIAEQLKKRAIHHYEVISGIKQATKNKLSQVLDYSQKSNEVDRQAEKIQSATKITRTQLMGYIYALNEKYLNVDFGNLNPKKRKEYIAIKNSFERGIRSHVYNRITYIQTTVKDQSKREIAYKKIASEIENDFKKLANRDGVFDYAELKKFHEGTKKRISVMQLINQAKTVEEAIKILKSKEVFKASDWQRAAGKIVDSFIESARQNGSEGNLIAFAEKASGKKNLNFSQASSELTYLIRKKARAGVKEGFEFIHRLNKALNKERAEIIENTHVSPKSIRVMVLRERRQLLSGRTRALMGRDKIVVKFMRANRGERRRMIRKALAELEKSQRTGVPLRNHLFQAIQDIDKHYLRIYNRNYKTNVPKKINQLSTRRDPGNPTGHDKIARLLALRTLAKEAKWIIKNYNNHPDFKKVGLSSKLEGVRATQSTPKLRLLFEDAKRLYGTRYFSLAARNGFTGREMALATFKVIAGVTLLVNYMNFRREHGWIEGGVKLATNPYALASVGILHAVKLAKRDPRSKQILKRTAGGQETLMTHSTLTGLSQKQTTRGKLVKYLGNENEFNVIHHIMKNPASGSRKVAILLRKAAERAPKDAKKTGDRRPKITNDDLYKLVGKKTLIAALPKSGNEYQRYLFFSKFLTNPKLNSEDLHNNAKSWITGLNS